MGRLTVRRISPEEARDHIEGPGIGVPQGIGHRGQVPGIGAGDLSYQPILLHGNPPQELGSPFKQSNYLAAKRCPVPSYDIVTVEHASGLVPRHHHGHTLGNASSHHFPHGRSGEVMRDAPHQSVVLQAVAHAPRKSLMRSPSRACGALWLDLPLLHGLEIAEDVRDF